MSRFLRGASWLAVRFAVARAGRIVLLGVAVGSGVAIWSAVAISNDSIDDGAQAFIERFGGVGGVRLVGPTATGGITPEQVAAVARVPDVRRVTPVVVELASVSPGGDGDQPVLVVGIDCTWTLARQHGCTPSLLDALGTQPFAVGPAVVRGGATVLHSDLGPLAIASAIRVPELSSLNEGRVVVMSLDGASRAFGRGGNVDWVFASDARAGSRSTPNSVVLDDLREAVGGRVSVFDVDAPWPEVEKVLSTFVPLLRLLGWVTLVVVGLVVLCLVRFDLDDQRRALAVLAAVGSPPHAQAAVVGATAVVGGGVGGFVGGFVGALVAAPIVDSMSSITESAVGLHLTVAFRPQVVVWATFVGVAVAVLASAGAVRRSARLDVVDELGPGDGPGPPAPPVPWRRGAALVTAQVVAVGLIVLSGWRGGQFAWQERVAIPAHVLLVVAMLVGWSAFAAIALRMGRPIARRVSGLPWLASENAARDGSRTTTTVLGIAAAVSLSLVIGSTVASVVAGSERWADAGDGVTTSRRMGGEEIAAVDAVPGVAGRDAERRVYLNAPYGLTMARVVDGRFPPHLVFDGPRQRSTLRRHLAGGAIAVGPSVARDAGVRAGDRLVVAGPRGRVSARVAAVWDDGSFGGASITMSKSLGHRLFGDMGSPTSTWRPVEGLDAASLRDRIEAALGDVSPPLDTRDETVRQVAEQAQAALQPFRVLQASLLMAATVSLGLMFATSVRNRRREIAVLVAIGQGPSRVRALLVVEALQLGGLGCALGALSGAILTIATIRIAPFSLGYRNPVVLDVMAAITSSAVAMALVLIVSACVATLAARADPVRALSAE